MDGFPLLRLRRAAGLTQQELALKAGVSSLVIGKIERGEVDPRLATLTAIADALGVTVVDLLEDSRRTA